MSNCWTYNLLNWNLIGTFCCEIKSNRIPSLAKSLFTGFDQNCHNNLIELNIKENYKL